MNEEILDMLKVILEKVERTEKAIIIKEQATPCNEDTIISNIVKSNTAKTAWEEAKAIIKEELTSISYKQFIEPISLSTAEAGEKIILSVPNEHMKETINKHYYNLIIHALKLVNKNIKKVTISWN
ncbi:DnaA N-terminal domain-containing protein [Clostridium kluyveri]|uniref:DnaA N-terminal domain-containing protein n=1 Tax=Clostridium kluyveri TaxID=1534 RepID=UPI00224700B1|nr:DnaA N-terminal domain-containing protein [Clostridium kluyveri]UZQ52019.1 hypothetical protein OP486_07615 [Clostridium kluyveri]